MSLHTTLTTVGVSTGSLVRPDLYRHSVLPKSSTVSRSVYHLLVESSRQSLGTSHLGCLTLGVDNTPRTFWNSPPTGFITDQKSEEWLELIVLESRVD